MPLKKPLPILVPQRVRRVPRSFAWIDHRLRSEGFLERVQPEPIERENLRTHRRRPRGLSRIAVGRQKGTVTSSHWFLIA